MRTQWIFKQKGVTLIELLVALVICGVVIGAIYRLFIVQTRAYTVQDQVVEVQQNVRSAMEIMLRDLRMTGYDDDNPNSTETITTPIATSQTNSITVNYEYYDRDLAQYQSHQVAYSIDGSSNLVRTLTPTANGAVVNPPGVRSEVILQNVNALNFTYGIDTDVDGDVDSWGSVTGKIIAVQVTLTGRPDQTNPDVQTRVSPRTLTSAVSFRNLIMK